MAGVIALWSVVPVLVKWLLPAIDPFGLAFARLLQALLVVGIAFRLRGRRLEEIEWSRWHLVGGLGVTVNYAFFAWSLSYTTASAGALVVQIQYVTLALLAVLLLKEPFGPGKGLGMMLVLGGVVLVVSVRGHVGDLLAPRYVAGNALMLLAGLGWGVYAVSNKALSGHMGSLSVLLPMLALATVLTGGLALLEEFAWGEVTLRQGLWLALLGLAATGGAFLLVAQALKRLTAGLTGTLTTLTPLAQIGLAHTLLDEPLSWSLAVGGALILSGILAMIVLERGRSERVFR